MSSDLVIDPPKIGEGVMMGKYYNKSPTTSVVCELADDSLVADLRDLLGARDDDPLLRSINKLLTYKDPFMDSLLSDGHENDLGDEFGTERTCVDIADILPEIDSLGGPKCHMDEPVAKPDHIKNDDVFELLGGYTGAKDVTLAAINKNEHITEETDSYLNSEFVTETALASGDRGNAIIQKADVEYAESDDSGEPYEIEDWEFDEILAKSDIKETEQQALQVKTLYGSDNSIKDLKVNEFCGQSGLQVVLQDVPKITEETEEFYDSDDSGEPYTIEDWEFDQILAGSDEKGDGQQICQNAFVGEDPYDSDDSGEPYTIEDWEIDEILAQSEDKEPTVSEKISSITSDDDEDSGEEYDIEDWEIDEIIARHDREQANLAGIVSNVLKSANECDDSSTQNSQISLYPWIFEEPCKSPIQKAKGRMIKLMRRVLKPFKVFKGCVKKPANDN